MHSLAALAVASTLSIACVPVLDANLAIWRSGLTRQLGGCFIHHPFVVTERPHDVARLHSRGCSRPAREYLGCRLQGEFILPIMINFLFLAKLLCQTACVISG